MRRQVLHVFIAIACAPAVAALAEPVAEDTTEQAESQDICAAPLGPNADHFTPQSLTHLAIAVGNRLIDIGTALKPLNPLLPVMTVLADETRECEPPAPATQPAAAETGDETPPPIVAQPAVRGGVDATRAAVGDEGAKPLPPPQPVRSILPPLSSQPGLPAIPGPQTQPSVVVRKVKFIGNKHVRNSELQRVVKPFLGRPLTMEDLEAARVAVTKYLIDKGYINSGAVLPEQTVENGVVTLQIVEGTLSDVRLTGNKRLSGNYIISRLRRSSESPPLNILSLKDQLELLRQDPNLRRINAELRPGSAPGQSVLDVQVEENNPFQLALQFSNRRPPSVGSTALDVLFTDRNLTGNGDLLFLRYDAVNGPLDDLHLAGAEDFGIDYTIPISPSDTTLNFNFTRTDSVVVEAPFEDLDINSRLNAFALTVRQPIYRRPVPEPPTPTSRGTPAMEIALFGTVAYRENATTLLGEPFDFSGGSDNGKTRVFAVRLGQEFTTRSPDEALSVRSTFSFGTPWFNSTAHGDNTPDGQFISWLGQVQYVRRLGKPSMLPADVQLVLRGAAQLANSPLLTTEQFAVGGFDTVRGYRENQLVRDEGFSLSAELRIPLIVAKGGQQILTAAPFFDVGRATDLTGALGSEDLASLGIGLIYTPGEHVAAQLYYGYPLMNRSDSRQDPQDVGLHFSVTVFAF